MNKFEKLIDLCKKKSLMFGSTESMTGGSFAAAITNVSGASSSYRGSLITYATKLKCEILNIDEKLIDQVGVVSSQVAKEMAIKGKEKLNVNVCVSITGNAGPSKCEGSAEVGDFYIGISNGEVTKTFFTHKDGQRNDIKDFAVDKMAEHLCNFIDEFF